MDTIEKLTKVFESFPGVGTRQAKRFCHHILSLSQSERTELSTLITSLKDNVNQCHSCYRYFSSVTNELECSICNSTTRKKTSLLAVANDSDILAIEKSNAYNGVYFVLGGTLTLLSENESKKIRGNALLSRMQQLLAENTDKFELILGLPVNPDGENTCHYIMKKLTELETSQQERIQVTKLGRGLSTGSELEYADSETILNALKNRA